VTTRRNALTLLIVSAAGILIASSFTWVTAVVNVLGGAGTREVTVAGNAVVPTVVSLSIVALAGALAILALKGWARQMIGVLIVMVAILIEISVVRFAMNPIVESGNDTVGSVSLTPWWIIVMLLALVMMISGVITLGSSRAWSAMSAKYEGEAVRKESALSPWDALNAGQDPTSDLAEPNSDTEPA
jgi:Tryptophan-associated transmembrane protein (Trp_oprn_chp)